MKYRIEKDSLGEVSVLADALHGAHTQRALQNFSIAQKSVRPELIQAYGAVKYAALCVNEQLNFFPFDKETIGALYAACREMEQGALNSHIVIDALQGGAGTSTNMNVNEVLANRALVLLGRSPGQYEYISPLAHINLHQSTNDTYPTALKVAAIRMIIDLEQQILQLQESLQEKEKQFAHVVRVGRTQMQDAVLITVGRQFGAYAEAIGRDRWRIYKCQERLRVVNLGGTAVGTGLGAPKQYIFQVVERLRENIGLPLARAENLIDCTQNADVFAEVSGILCAHAVTMQKISSDLRFSSSGPDAGIAELILEQRQVGSSIMPAKVNPVIPEAVTQAAMQVLGNDSVIKSACAMGHLELNSFLPLVAENLLGSIGMLTQGARMLRKFCIDTVQVDEQQCAAQVNRSSALATALVKLLGYDQVALLVAESKDTQKSLQEIVLEKEMLTKEQLESTLSHWAVCKLGD